MVTGLQLPSSLTSNGLANVSTSASGASAGSGSSNTDSSGTVTSGSSSGGGASAALDQALARCKRQLGDWSACPGGQTPDGQKIIANLQSRLASLESQIQGSGSSSSGGSLNPTITGLGGFINLYA